jgi:hypothetical protein
MEFPTEWRTGKVWNKWEELQQKYAENWVFEFQYSDEQVIHLAAFVQTLEGKRNYQYEIIESRDFSDLEKVCCKIESLAQKVCAANRSVS